MARNEQSASAFFASQFKHARDSADVEIIFNFMRKQKRGVLSLENCICAALWRFFYKLGKTFLPQLRTEIFIEI